MLAFQKAHPWCQNHLEFENANTCFYQNLKEEFNGLTESELQIAAMQVSGLSNKEIAAITGKQLGSLHRHKSRLRKKVGAENDEEMLKILHDLPIVQCIDRVSPGWFSRVCLDQ